MITKTYILVQFMNKKIYASQYKNFWNQISLTVTIHINALCDVHCIYVLVYMC